MATITRENIGLLNDKLTVRVEKEDYLSSFEKTLKQYSKSANIPGFRKGMVPAGVIKRMHGPAIFKDEVVKTVEKELGRYMTEEKPEIFAQPLPLEIDAPRLDMNQPAEYTFQFEIGLKPNPAIDLGKIKATRYEIDVTDEMIQTEVDRLRNRFGKVVDKEESDTDEDILNLTFVESDAEGNPLEGAPTKEIPLTVKYFKDPATALGKKPGDKIVVQLGNAFDDKEQEFLVKDLNLDPHDPAELERYWALTVTKVGRLEKRDLGEDFYNEVYPGQGITTETALREKIASEIRLYWERQTRDFLHHELYHQLLDKTQFELPEAFLKRWLQVGGEKPKSAEEVEEEFPTFKSQLRWTLISDHLIRENHLDVTPEELREYMRQQVLGYFGQMNLGDGNMEWIDSYVDRMTKDEQQVESAYRRIVTEKMFNWAEGEVSLTPKTIGLEEFSEMQHAHSHEH
ncbi:MAG TPA: trigger factor [Dinghuibacter sp.]|uniref:trigger factor n=1 Tax=Dinghuibacter sp. TaxID=2024697 RepID=UPI002B7D7A4C|nr:trigger factor [Dinghuibacter sp.]HTJ12145.1 trigger factor [Dinghuibacter sp.]